MYEKADFWLCLNAMWNYRRNWLADRKRIYHSGTVLDVFDFGGIECYIILFFYALAVIGIVVAAKALKEDK